MAKVKLRCPECRAEVVVDEWTAARLVNCPACILPICGAPTMRTVRECSRCEGSGKAEKPTGDIEFGGGFLACHICEGSGEILEEQP